MKYAAIGPIAVHLPQKVEDNDLLGAEFPRWDPPLLVAATLLVPGYVDADHVGKIAHFVARLDSAIPYSLLAFHPEFEMMDLPPTSQRQAMDCLDAARAAGLNRVRIGNRHLLQ